MKRLALVIVAAASVIAVQGRAESPPVNTAPRPGLSAGEMQSLIQASQRGDEIALRAIVIAAIARDSGNASVVISHAVSAVPAYADFLVESASRVFPDLTKRLAAAAKEVREKQQARVPPLPSDAPPEPSAEPEPVKPERNWSGETALGGSFRSGTVRSVNANANFKLIYKTGPWQTEGVVDFDYDRSNSVTSTQRLRLKGKPRRDITERLYGFGIAEYEDDRFSGFDYQVTEGVGVGYRLIESPTFRVDVEGGPSLRQSKIEQSKNINHELLGRLATNIAWEMSDTAKFTNETALLFSKNTIEVESASTAFIQDSTETRNVSALDMKIIGNLAARLSYEVSFRPDPPPNGKVTEMFGKISLVHSF
ncbi:MAG: DUF481 domain-containing protein [Rhodospirillales bacterium]